jgi:ABC-2 type transport system permease protein
VKNLHARYRYSLILLKQLVKTDFKLRYQNSVLGYLWSLLRPLALFTIMYVVFVRFLHVDYGVPHSATYLLLGLVLWNFFGEITSGSISAIVGRGDILRKINFPKYVIILAGSCAALINLLLNLVVVAIFMLYDKVDITTTIVFLPLLVLELFVFALALGFFLSALFVRFRDINYIWEVVMQAGFYGTPIFYPLVAVPLKYAKIQMLNPVAQVMQDARYAVISHKSQTISTVWGTPWIRVVPIVIAIFIAFVASRYFRKRSKFFAEEI